MKTFIASTIVALTLIAGVAGPASAFDAGSFFAELDRTSP